jgi:hypothetical protein
MGRLIMVDDKFAIEDDPWIDDFGCRRTVTRVTPYRVRGSIIEEDELPMEAAYDAARRQWAAWRPGSTRPIWIEGVPEQGTVEAVALDAADASPDVMGRRMRRMQEMLEADGRRLVDVDWKGRRKPSKKALAIFGRWAEHALVGGDPDDQALWDALYADGGSDATNAVYETAFPTRWGAGRGYGIRPGDVVALFSRSRQVPDLIVGDPPAVDWCAELGRERT